MNFLKQYFSLRFKLIYRNTELAGLFWVVPIGLVLGFAYVVQSYPDFLIAKRYALLLVNALMLFFIHFKRNDLKLLKLTLSKQRFYTVLLLEYGLISLPFLMLALYLGLPLLCLIVLFVLCLPLVRVSNGVSKKTISFFKKYNVELNSGFRRFGVVCGILLIALIAVFFISSTFYFKLFIFGLFTASLSLFLSEEEHPSFIRVFNASPKKFIVLKLTRILKPVVWIAAVTYLIMLIINPAEYMLITVVAAQAFLFNVNTLLDKYANYQNTAGKVISAIVRVVFGVVPLLLPLNLLLAVYFRKKSLETLSIYLNDNHK